MKPKSFVLNVLLFIIMIVLVSIPSQAKLQDETLTLHTIDLDGKNQSYYLYLPSNPKGAVLILPSFAADHNESLDGDNWGKPEQSMENSPIVKAARDHHFALVFAQGEKREWYSPNNGERKVLACLDDANTTLKLSSDSWFIYGFSMGGSGALTISIRHPNLFSGLYIGDGVMNFTDPDLIEIVDGFSDWGPNEFFQDVNPFLNIEAFRDKAVFIASGTTAVNLPNCDNFSRALDLANIRHYYYRGDGGHNVYLLFDSVNQTFNLFSHQLTGTVDQFYENYISPLKTTSTTPWAINSLISTVITVAFGWIAKKRSKNC